MKIIQTNTYENRAIVTAWIRMGLDVWIHEGKNIGPPIWFEAKTIPKLMLYMFTDEERYSIGKPHETP